MGSVSRTSQYNVIALSREADRRTTGMILMVGEPQRLQTLKKHFPDRSGVFFIEFSDLSREILQSIQPSVVVSPAISTGFDCLDLASFLERCRYQGAFRIMAHDLPRPDIIKGELRQNFPSLNFDILRKEVLRPKVPLH